LKEETNLDIRNPKVISVVNCLDTYREDNKHYISVILTTNEYSGDLKNMEPNKCEGWEWVDPKNLPMPHFDASELGIKCYLNNIFYTDK
jgi:ADP-ribose pyrophosphatase YjhB (NUDIX family)